MEPTILEFDARKFFDEFIKLIHLFPPNEGRQWIYRGHSDCSWDLIPKAGRPDFFMGNDLFRFKYWKSLAVAYDSTIPENDWEALAVAQHYGLATRLLDWTINPLVALYFAVFENLEKDACFYCYHPDQFIDYKNSIMKDGDFVFVYRPRAVVLRILNQIGLFTYHGIPQKPIEVKEIETPKYLPVMVLNTYCNIVKIVIPAKAKESILSTLHSFGINQVYLFPDLDGLSRHINLGTKAEVIKIKFNKLIQEQSRQKKSPTS